MQYHFLLNQSFITFFSLLLILTPRKKVTFDKSEVAHLFREYFPEDSWPYSQQTNTEPNPDASRTLLNLKSHTFQVQISCLFSIINIAFWELLKARTPV